MEDETSERRNNAKVAIMELANMMSVPMCLTAVIRLNVADALWQGGANTPLSAREILERANKPSGDPENLQRFLRVLTSYGVFEEHLLNEDEDGGLVQRKYSLTDIGRTLVTDAEGLSFAFYILQHHQEELMKAWSFLHEAVLDPTREPFVWANGEQGYSYYAKRPEMTALMQKGMGGVSVSFMRAFLNKYEGLSKDVETLVDVGGSGGHCLKMIVEKHPHIRRAINFDLPGVVANAPAIPGITHVGGNMFESIPAADAIFTKWVLATFPDEECKVVMKRCYNVLPAGGKLIVCDPVVPKHTDNSIPTRATLENDIYVMAMYNVKGKNRTEDEHKQLGLAAGFSKFQAFYFDHFYTVLEFQK